MAYELFIAQRMKLGESSRRGALSLNIATAGIVLAIVVMLLSVTVMTGFRDEITSKVYGLDPDVKISNAVLGIDDTYATINGHEAIAAIRADSTLASRVASMSLIADKPAILKTDSDFKGIQFRGVDSGFDWTFLRQHIVDGRLPNDTAIAEVAVSSTIAKQIGLSAGSTVLTYFIDERVRVRKLAVTGLFNTDFESFDNALIIGNIGLVQQVSGWNGDTGNFVGLKLVDTDRLGEDAYHIYSTLARATVEHHSPTLFHVTHTRDNNMAFFAWLDMLNMNVVVILVLMMIVAGFTLISALLMIVLERIRMVGILKALGASNAAVRRIFILLTQRLIVKAMIIGNLIGIAFAMAQRTFHFITLDPEAYYMDYVPITVDWAAIAILNIGILAISFVTLIGPSYIISTIKPTTTMRFE